MTIGNTMGFEIVSKKAASRSARKGVPGYESEPMRRKTKLVTEEYEYELPFNYPNVTVNRRYYAGSEFHGIEINAVNSLNNGGLADDLRDAAGHVGQQIADAGVEQRGLQ